MRYLDESTGTIYSQSDVEKQAMEENIPFDEFVTSKGYQIMEDAAEVEEVKIEDVVINNSANAASQNTAQTDTTDLDLDNVSLESLETPETPEEINNRDKYEAYNNAKQNYEEYNKTYNFGYGENRGTKFNQSNFLSGSTRAYSKNKELKRLMDEKARLLGPDFDLPATLYELDEDQFVDAFRKEFPGISIVQTDIGDAVKINVNGKDEYLDLQRFLPGKNYYKNFDRVIKDVQLMDSQLTADNRVSSITAGVVYQMKDGEFNKHYVNQTLKGTGYSIDQINKKGGKNTGMELLFNNEVVLQDTSVDNSGGKLDSHYTGNAIEEYLKKNLTADQNNIVKEKSYELLDVFLTKQAKEKAKVNDNISEEEVKKQYATTDFIPSVMAIAEGANLNPVQKDILKIYLQQQQEKAATENIIPSGANAYGIPDEKIQLFDYNIATSLAGLADVEGGQAILNALQTNDIVGQLNEAGLVSTRRGLVENKMLTISERLLVETGDVDLIRLAQTYKYAPVEAQQDAIDKKVINFKNSDNQIQKLLSEKLETLGNELPDGAGFKVVTTEFDGNIQRVFNITFEPEGKPTDEEINKFNELRVKFWKLQTNISRLDNDRVKSVHNIINDINNLPDLNEITVIKDENGNEFEVNKNIYDLAFKEYDVGDLLFKDLSDATSQILLTVPTLFGSESALDAQRQLNEKNKYYRSLGTYDDGQGGGFLFTMRTLAQQFPNIALAIGTVNLINIMLIKLLKAQVIQLIK